jgi:transcriptional regulator with XRE-family HTH domain
MRRVVAIDTSRGRRREVGPHFSEGAARLWRRLGRGLRQTAMAREVGVDGGFLSRLLWGDALPGIRTAEAIYLRYRIGLRLWCRPPARAFVPPRGRGGRAGEAAQAGEAAPAPAAVAAPEAR